MCLSLCGIYHERHVLFSQEVRVLHSNNHIISNYIPYCWQITGIHTVSTRTEIQLLCHGCPLSGVCCLFFLLSCNGLCGRWWGQHFLHKEAYQVSLSDLIYIVFVFSLEAFFPTCSTSKFYWDLEILLFQNLDPVKFKDDLCSSVYSLYPGLYKRRIFSDLSFPIIPFFSFSVFNTLIPTCCHQMLWSCCDVVTCHCKTRPGTGVSSRIQCPVCL